MAKIESSTSKKAETKKSTKKVASTKAKSQNSESKKEEVEDEDDTPAEEEIAEEPKPAKKKSSKKTDSQAPASKSKSKKTKKGDGNESMSGDDDDVDDADESDEEVKKFPPEVQKLLDYARTKQVVSWDEITEILTQDFVNSSGMEEVLQLLNKNNIQVMEEADALLEEDADDEVDDEDLESSLEDDDAVVEAKIDETGSQRLVTTGDKDVIIDDPIKLYLREIGKGVPLKKDGGRAEHNHKRNQEFRHDDS